MKIINILGGLGNQMFQYAFALAMQKRHPDEEIRIDSSGFNGYPLHNGYELDRIFHVDIPEASWKEQMSVFFPLRNYRMWQLGTRILPKRKSVVNETKDMHYDGSLMNISGSMYFLGYWQTEKYFKNIKSEILYAFSFPPVSSDSNIRLIEKLKGKTTVGVHVRRGDYLKISNASGICTLEYYRKAIDLINTKVCADLFVIFSDDMQWCRDNLSDSFGNIEVIYVDWNKKEESFRDMQLMCLCSHNIIANSSFSWWGAWLNQNPDKIVIAPSRWMNGGGWVDIIPSDWCVVEV